MLLGWSFMLEGACSTSKLLAAAAQR